MRLRVCCVLIICGLIGRIDTGWAQDRPATKTEFKPRTITASEFAELTYTAETRFEQTKLDFSAKTSREIAALHRHCPLSDEQRTALREAGVAEFALWQALAAELQPKIVGRPLEFLESRRADIDMGFLRNRYHERYYDPDGLFQKRAMEVLTLEQMPGYVEYRQEQRRERLNRIWEHVSSRMHSPVKLSKASREKLTTLILDQVPPLLKNGEYASIIVFLQLNEHRDQVRQILSDEEWAAFEAEVLRAGWMEGTLRHYKLWPIPQPDATSPE
jgi:hypothetical protein